MVSFKSFSNELEKIASVGGLGEHLIEAGGLGILAAPHAYNAITGKKVGKKTERNTELAGLGVLAGPSVKAIGKHLLKRAGAFDKALNMQDAGRVAANQVAKAKPQFTMAHLQQAYKTQGLKPGLGSVARKVVSHL